MENKIATRYSGVVTQLTQVKAGLETYATPLNLTLVTVADVTPILTALGVNDQAAKQARTELANRQGALRNLDAGAREFVRGAREVLKPYLGKKYSVFWQEAGFIGSHRIPRKADQLAAVLAALKGYFTAHTAHENAPLSITAAAAQLYYDDLVAARNAVNSQETTWQLALDGRDSKKAEAQDLVRAVIRELTGKLDPMDERWAAFGLNKPGQLKTPLAPGKVTAAQTGSLVVVKWDRAVRAAYYRIWKRVTGTEGEEWVPLGNTDKLSFNIEGLAVGTTLEIAVSAVNNGGESIRSELATVTVAA